MIWGISFLQFCKKSADHKKGNICSEVPFNKVLDEIIISGKLYLDLHKNSKLKYTLKYVFL